MKNKSKQETPELMEISDRINDLEERMRHIGRILTCYYLGPQEIPFIYSDELKILREIIEAYKEAIKPRNPWYKKLLPSRL